MHLGTVVGVGIVVVEAEIINVHIFVNMAGKRGAEAVVCVYLKSLWGWGCRVEGGRNQKK